MHLFPFLPCEATVLVERKHPLDLTIHRFLLLQRAAFIWDWFFCTGVLCVCVKILPWEVNINARFKLVRLSYVWIVCVMPAENEWSLKAVWVAAGSSDFLCCHRNVMCCDRAVTGATAAPNSWVNMDVDVTISQAGHDVIVRENLCWAPGSVTFLSCLVSTRKSFQCVLAVSVCFLVIWRCTWLILLVPGMDVLVMKGRNV